MKPVLIIRALVPGKVHAISDSDRPALGPLAVALRDQRNGWQVTARGGRVIGERLDQVSALKLMRQTGKELSRRFNPNLAQANRSEVTTCPF